MLSLPFPMGLLEEHHTSELTTSQVARIHTSKGNRDAPRPLRYLAHGIVVVQASGEGRMEDSQGGKIVAHDAIVLTLITGIEVPTSTCQCKGRRMILVFMNTKNKTVEDGLECRIMNSIHSSIGY